MVLQSCFLVHSSQGCVSCIFVNEEENHVPNHKKNLENVLFERIYVNKLKLAISHGPF
jgi:hypothetical protein